MTAIAGRAGAGLAGLRARLIAEEPRRLATALFAAIVVMAALGALDRAGAPLGLFDLDGEGKPPALLSALVLAAGATLAALISTLRDERRWLALAAFLAFMALDEAGRLHETLQDALWVDWQHLYFPIAALGGVAWLLVLLRLEDRERLLFALGALAWVVSQIDERYQSNPADGRVEGYGTLSTIEETLEITGSALFVLALHGALRRMCRARRSPGP